MDWLSAITTVGFPIAACSYLALRFEGILNHQSQVLEDLKDAILQLQARLPARR